MVGSGSNRILVSGYNTITVLERIKFWQIPGHSSVQPNHRFSVWLSTNILRTFVLIRIPLFQKIKIMRTAEIHTGKGVMKVEFYEKDAPKTVENFIKLAKEGFYDGLTFHRVIPDFVIQGGCPNSREGAKGVPGTGGPGYKIDCELTGENQYHDRGVLSMAHAGRNTGGSQFFIVHNRKNTAHLDRNHTCFGKVVEGVDVIDQIRANDRIEKIVVNEE